MAEEHTDNVDILNARVNAKSKPLTPEQRARKQARFLSVYRKCGNIKHSCAYAGISRQTYYEWRDKDADFQAQLPDSRSDANDTLEYAGYDRAVQGVPSYVVSQGRMVYEEIPDFNADGTPKFDEHGKPVYLRGRPLIERKYSDSLLTTLLKANMPEKYKERMEHSGKVDATIEHTGLVIDTRTLSPERLAQLKEIAQEMKGKE